MRVAILAAHRAQPRMQLPVDGSATEQKDGSATEQANKLHERSVLLQSKPTISILQFMRDSQDNDQIISLE